MVNVDFRSNDPDERPSIETDPYAIKAPERSGDRSEHAPDGRSEAIGRLAGMLATFAAQGDTEGARAMHDAIGRLLGTVAGRGEGATVVDLEAVRQARNAAR